jgi:EmrB/QacA subfamily drug resistance transporter
MITPLIVACALFMENLDSTVVSTALPTIAKAFKENPVHLNLAITSYLLSLAVFIPISGWVADRYGARHVFRIAIIVFTGASILCGLSNSLAEFVAARILQGIGGAMMVPVGRLVVLRAVAKTQLVSAMAYLTVPALVGPVIGPPVGGFIVTYFSWRWIFWLNLPIGLLGILLATLFIADAREPKTPPLDLTGFILSGVGLSGLVFAFETMGRGILPGWIVTVLLIAGLVTITLYVRHAHRVAHPVIDLKLLRIPTFRTNIWGGTLFRIGIGALPFLMPLLLQLGFGLSALHSGLLTFAAAAGALFMKLTAGPILRRFGFKRTMIANALISAAFLASYSFFQLGTPGWVILALLLAGGFFRSLQFTALNTIAYADMPPEKMSLATSFASMAQQLSMSLGVGVGALALHVSVSMHGGQLNVGDFTFAFYVVAVCSAASALTFITLPANAGDEVSGHASAPAPRPALQPDPLKSKRLET